MLDEHEADFVGAHAASADAAPGEGELAGGTAFFPHALADAVDPGAAFRATPFADETLLQLGLARYQAGARDDPWALEPLYLRPSSAEEQWQRRSVNPSI